MVTPSKVTKRYKVLLEESWYHEQAEDRLSDRRWYEIIPCRGFKPRPGQEGPFISLYDEDPPTLKLYTTRRKQAMAIWREIKKHAGTRADFYFDEEAVLYFPPGLLETVAEMAGARKKPPPRIMTDEQKAALAEMGRKALQKLRESTSKPLQNDPILNDPDPGKGVGRRKRKV